MIEVKITDEMKKGAYNKALEMGELRNSITKGQGNIAGFLGEFVANSIICGSVSNTFDYDITDGLIKYDVKTKRCTSKPRDFYECSVASFNIKQKCDRYVFVRLEFKKNEWTRAWMLGWMGKQDYFKKSKQLKKGDIDTSNNFKVKADCYNLKIKDLNQFKEVNK